MIPGLRAAAISVSSGSPSGHEEFRQRLIGEADGLMHSLNSATFSVRAAAIERELECVLSPVFPL